MTIQLILYSVTAKVGRVPSAGSSNDSNPSAIFCNFSRLRSGRPLRGSGIFGFRVSFSHVESDRILIGKHNGTCVVNFAR